MARLRVGFPARAARVLLATLALLPSLRWCGYAWAEVPVECLLGTAAAWAAPPPTCAAPPPTSAAPPACGESCARRSHDADLPAPPSSDPADRAWCPGGPLGGSGVAARNDGAQAPALAVLPQVPEVVGAAPEPAPAPPPARARPPTDGASAPPPIRAPPDPCVDPLVHAGPQGPAGHA